MTVHPIDSPVPLGAARKAGRVALAFLLAWLVAAVAAGLSGATTRVAGPLAVVVVGGGVVTLAAAYALSSGFRAWALSLDPRALILFHVLRLGGIAFLFLHAGGRLPAAFALPAGWGDVAAGLLAPLAAAAVPWRTPGRRRAVLAWNLFGLADILYAVGAGLTLGLADRAAMAAIWTWPYSLVPSLGAPLIIATHLLLLAQLARREPGWAGQAVR